MVKSQMINRSLQEKVLDGKKIPHSTSYPVIYKEADKYYLAVFVFFFSKEDIEVGMVERPSMWGIADIENGELIVIRKTVENEFSNINLEKSCINSVEIKNSNFIDINLKDSWLNNSFLKNVTFENTDLSSVDFEETKFDNVSFCDCNLSNTVFNSYLSSYEKTTLKNISVENCEDLKKRQNKKPNVER